MGNPTANEDKMMMMPPPPTLRGHEKNRGAFLDQSTRWDRASSPPPASKTKNGRFSGL